jgi:hypothetical protein
VAVDRRRHRDDEDVAGFQVGFVQGEGQLTGGRQFVSVDLQGPIMAGLQLGDPLGADVKADDRIMIGQGDGQGQADIAQSDHADFHRGLGEGTLKHSCLDAIAGVLAAPDLTSMDRHGDSPRRGDH